jgi:hypothetical protein
MKIQILSIIFILFIVSVNAQEFTLNIASSTPGIIALSVIANNPTGTSYNGAQTTDLTFTIEYPTSAGVTLGTFTGTTANITTGGTGPIVTTAGAPQIVGSNTRQGYQIGNSNGINWPTLVQGVPFLLGTHSFTATNGNGSNATLIVITGQPNIQFNAIEDFTPSLTGFAPLPIDIKSFSVSKDGDRNARLDWSTCLEINSAYFGIERSTDGKSWEGISKVGAAGNSNTEQFYTYTDRDLPLNRSKDQIFYYRLQLVDLDGWYKYSDVRGVNFGKASTDKIISIYPNPAVQMVNLDLFGMDLETGAIHLRVTDMQGRNMIDKTILGNGIEPIEVTQLPAGTYNVAVSQGTTLHQKQFIKID